MSALTTEGSEAVVLVVRGSWSAAEVSAALVSQLEHSPLIDCLL